MMQKTRWLGKRRHAEIWARNNDYFLECECLSESFHIPEDATRIRVVKSTRPIAQSLRLKKIDSFACKTRVSGYNNGRARVLDQYYSFVSWAFRGLPDGKDIYIAIDYEVEV
jgi:hypothetical protein